MVLDGIGEEETNETLFWLTFCELILWYSSFFGELTSVYISSCVCIRSEGDLHGDMNTWEMVEFHLEQDHEELHADWTELVSLFNRAHQPPIDHFASVGEQP